MDFRRNTPALPPLTITDSTVTAVESFRFLGTTISQDLKWDNHIDSIVRKAQQRLYFLHQLRKFNLPQELLKQFYSAIIESVLWTSITVWFSSATKSDLRRLQRVVRTAEQIIGTTLPTLQELYSSRVSKRAGKITLDPHIQHTPSLNCYRLVDATELWAPEQPDLGTVSSLRQSISWTFELLTINMKHATLSYFFFNLTHTYYISNLYPTYLYILNCLFVYRVCAILHIVHFVYLYIIFLLSVSYPVAVILSHCGATVNKTNSSYVQTYLAIKLILILILNWTELDDDIIEINDELPLTENWVFNLVNLHYWHYFPILILWSSFDTICIVNSAIYTPVHQSRRAEILASLFIGYCWIVTHLQLNQLMLQFQRGSRLLNVCVKNTYFRCCEICDTKD